MTSSLGRIQTGTLLDFLPPAAVGEGQRVAKADSAVLTTGLVTDVRALRREAEREAILQSSCPFFLMAASESYCLDNYS